MVTPNRKVLDCSHHNTVTDWKAIKNAGIVGIIWKASEGATYQDPTFEDARRNALNHGLLFGGYHFANGKDVQSQVNNFLNVVGVYDDILYALDWENDPGGDTMTEPEAREFVELLEQKIGPNRTVIYSGNVAKECINGCDPFWSARRLWLAHYSSEPVCQASWDTYFLHQYSDGQHGPDPKGCPGVSGYVDTNAFAGSDQELIHQWSGAAIPPEQITPRVDIEITGKVHLYINGMPVEL